jgi:hypothetical protein
MSARTPAPAQETPAEAAYKRDRALLRDNVSYFGEPKGLLKTCVEGMEIAFRNRQNLDAPVQPVAVPDGPSAEDYSDMLRDFFFRYAAGGYNDEGGLVPLETAKDKLEWIVNEAIQHAAPVQAQEPVAYIWSVNGMVKTGGDSIFDDREKFYCAPVQPVAVPDGEVIKAAQALLDEHKSACLTDPVYALIEMAKDDEEALVSAALLADLFRAIDAAPAAQGDAKDAELLDFLQGRVVDTIYLDDGQIIDVKGGDVRAAIAAKAAS